MIRIETRLRLLWLTLACTTLATTLTACGGGGGGGSTPTPPPPPPPPAPTESAYLLAEFVATDSNNQAVRVWDPAQPTVAVQNVKLVMSNGILWTSSHLLFSDATSYDATSRTVTTLGHAKVFYDNDGKLYSIDLRGGQSHVPVQLSSAVDVFMPTHVYTMNAGGDDAWVDAQGGSHDWAIRTSMAASAAPVNVRNVVAPLRDAATGLPQYFFAALGDDGTHPVAATYEIADAATFTQVAVPAVSGMVAADGWIGADPAQAGLGYVGIAGQVRELHWSASGVSVDAGNLRSLTGPSLRATAADAQSLYVGDGTTLLSLTNGAARTVGSFAFTPATLVDAGGYVAAVEISGATTTQPLYQVEAVDKTSGTATLIEPQSAMLQLLAASDRGLVLAGTVEQPQAFVLASGDNLTRTTLGAQWVGVVRAASARVDQPAAPLALLSCVAGTTGFCLPGALMQLDFSGAGIALGNVTASAPMLRGDAITGLASSLSGQTLLNSPAGFGDDETDRRDAWQFTPATAGSLTRVTSNLP